jgi:hypothetical protein
MRHDVSAQQLSNIQTTPQGFLRIPASLTRVGVLEYTRADGTTQRELRPPEEVFRADSLASLELAPVTELHKGMITPSNVSRHQVGLVAQGVREDGSLVAGDVVVMSEAAIEAVRKKELVELSPGYSMTLDPTPGVWNGERYDAVQRDIQYNHVALLPRGAGRSGAEVALRMDAAVSFTEPAEPGGEPTPPTTPKTEIEMKKIKIRLDGVEYEIEIPEALAPTFEAAFAKLQNERTDAKDEVEKANGAKEAAEKKVAELQERLDAATSPEALDKAASERAEVIEKAKRFDGETDFAGMSLVDIRKAALKADGWTAERLDSAEDAFVLGAFEALKPTETEKRTPAVPGVSPKPEPREDGRDQKRTAKQAREEMLERSRNAWKKEAK